MKRLKCVEVYFAGQIDRAEMKDDENGAYVLYSDVEELERRLREQYLRPWRQGASGNLGCDCCGCSWEEPKQEHHTASCIVGLTVHCSDSCPEAK